MGKDLKYEMFLKEPGRIKKTQREILRPGSIDLIHLREHVLNWSNFKGVPSVFPPAEHEHDWDAVADKPVTTEKWKRTVGPGGDYATWAAMVDEMPYLFAHDAAVTIKKGTTLKEDCKLYARRSVGLGAKIVIKAEDYFPKTGSLPTASSATTTTLVDSSQSWLPDRFAGMWVLIVDGTGTDNGFVKITGNDATSLTVASWPGTQPDATSRYQIVGSLFDGEGSLYYLLDTSYNDVAIEVYGVGFYNSDYYGLYSMLNKSVVTKYCGAYGNGGPGMYHQYGDNASHWYCGFVNNNTYGTSGEAGLLMHATGYTLAVGCGFSDNGVYGVYVSVGSYFWSTNNFGDGNGDWGTYADGGSDAGFYGTECSGSEGDHRIAARYNIVTSEDYRAIGDTSIAYSGDFVSTVTINGRTVTFTNDGDKYTKYEDDAYTWTPAYTDGKITAVTVGVK